MSGEINVLARTQIIEVNPTSGTVSVTNAGPQGPAGPGGGDPGDPGPPGEGVPTGGTTGQVLAKDTSADFDTEWVTPIQDAGDVPFTPASGIAATNVQSAIEEAKTDAVASAVTSVDGIGPGAVLLGIDRNYNLRTEDPADWTEIVISTENAVASGSSILFESGVAVCRGTGGSGTRSNRRSFRLIPGSPGGHSRVRSRWRGTPNNPAVASALPQHAHIHGAQQVGGLWTGVVLSHDVTFALANFFNMALWKQETSAGGTGAVFDTVPYQKDQWLFTSAVRTSNQVTLTGASGWHKAVKGSPIAVDAANNSYDVNTVVESVTATTIVYTHTGSDLTTTTGNVRLLNMSNTWKTNLMRSTAFTALTRTNGICTATVAAGHPWDQGDEMAVDGSVNSFDGVFRVTELPSATQIRWVQPGVADSAAGNTGTISNAFPYWVESEWFEGHLRARVWPSVSALAGSIEGPPSWASNWAVIASLGGLSISEPDPALGIGCGIGVCHPASGASTTLIEHRYDSISVASIA